MKFIQTKPYLRLDKLFASTPAFLYKLTVLLFAIRKMVNSVEKFVVGEVLICSQQQGLNRESQKSLPYQFSATAAAVVL